MQRSEKYNALVNHLARAIVWLDRWGIAKRYVLIMQVVPPIIFLTIVFGHWNVVLIALLASVGVFCAARIVFLSFRRRYERVLRPLLTLIASAGYLALGEHYEDRAGVFISKTALAMQDTCNSQGYCAAPANWQQDKNQMHGDYFRYLPGSVPLRVQLSLHQPAFPAAACQDGEKVSGPECPLPTTFLIYRSSEDNSGAEGGVNKPLQIWKRKSW